jgi:glycosyltransferase involved in cell wall biosynthesis
MLVLPLRLLFWRRANIVVRSGSVDYLMDKWGFLSKLYFRTAERLLRFADLVVSVAPSIQRHLAQRGIRSVVIRNGVSLRSDPRPIMEREQRQLVAVGRVTSAKNYAMLIEAAKCLRDRGVQVSIIGGADLSDESNRLRSLVNSKKVSNVTFTGVMDRDQVLERLSLAALFVNCSVNEGMSNSVLEAIQQGTPILLSNITANRDLGLPDDFYFDPASPTELSEKIVQALETPSDFLADRKRFDDWDEVVNKYRRYMSLP